MIRIEYSAKLQFEDRASFVVINRHLPVPNFTQEERDGYLYLTTDKLELRYKLGTYPVSNDRCNPNLQITLDVNGVEEVWYPGKQDPYNLKGTTRTLDRAEGDVREWLENGLCSREIRMGVWIGSLNVRIPPLLICISWVMGMIIKRLLAISPR